MANKRTDLDSDHLLPELDLDTLNDGLTDLEDGGGPIREFTTSFKRGFLEQARSRLLVRSFVQSALPDGYSRLMTGTTEAMRRASELKEDVQRRSAPDLDALLREAEGTLPTIRERTPENIYRKIEDRLKRLREQNEGYIASAPSPEQTGEQRDRDTVAEALQDLAGYQTELAQAQHEADQSYFETDQKRQSLRDRIDDRRYDVLATQLGRHTEALERQVTYQDQITYRYQRKSLELQYRSYFALRDLRKYAEVHQETQEKAFNALVHNTGLPEHLKFEKAERVAFGVRESFAKSISGQIAQSLPEFLSGYFPAIQENLGGKLTELLQAAGGAASMGGGMSAAGASAAGMAGDVAGDQAGGFIRGTLLPRAAMVARPYLDMFSDKLGGRQHSLGYLFDNAPSLLQDYTQDLNQSGGWRGALQAMVRSVVPSYMLDDEMKDGSFQTIDRQTGFNQLTQRSVVEIIPGYLSRILQEARMIRTGSDDIEREVYDITSGQFTGYSAARQAMQNRIINETQRRAIDTTLDDVVERYDPEGYLSSDARDALRERMLRDASRGQRFDPESYAGGQGYSPDITDETRQELMRFFQSQFELDDEGRLVGSLDNRQRRKAFSDAFLEVRNVAPDPRAELRRIMGAGSQELLRELGLVSSAFGQDRVNYDTVWDLYRSGDQGAFYPGREGEAPKTPVGTTYDNLQDGPSLTERVRSLKEAAKDKLRFSQDRIELPKLTPELIGKLPRLDAKTLAEISRWNPDLFEQIKTVDPDVEIRITPYLDQLTTRRSTLSREAMQALRDLANEEMTQPPADELADPPVPQRDQGQQWREQASERATDTVDALRTGWRQVRESRPPVAGSTAAASVVDQCECDHLKRLYALQQREAQSTESFRSQLLAELERGLAIREMPTLVTQEEGETVQTVSSADAGKQPGWFKRAASGMWGGLWGYYQHLWTGIGKGMGGAFSGMGQLTKNLLGGGGNNENRVEDVYLKGQPEEPVLLGRDIERGRYVDSASGEPIASIDDIEGEVWDVQEQRVALTKAEVAQGVYNRQGESLLRKSVSGILDFYNDTYLGGAKKIVKSIPDVGRFVGDVLAPEPDGYVRGEEGPRIRARLLKRGYYIDADGNPITSYRDITGAVWDHNGNQVLSDEEAGQLTRRDGSPLESLGTSAGKFARSAMALPAGIAKAGFKASAAVARKTFDLASAVSDRVIGLVRGKGGRRDAEDMSVNQQAVTILGAIYDLLDERLPGKQHRAGSWQEEFAEREAEREEAEDLAEEAEVRRNGVFGDLSQRMGAMLGMFRDREDALEDIVKNTEDLDGGDGTDIFAGGGNDGPDNRNRRRRQAPRGFRNKLRHYGGRFVRGAGRGAAALGRGALGLFGLGAGTAGAIGRGAGLLGRGALGAGRLATSGAGMLARGGLMAGGAIVSAVGAPVALAGAAVAGLATGGYFAWKNQKATSGAFRELRLTQYGFPPGWFSGPANKILAMEEVLTPATQRTEGGEPSFDMSQVDVRQLLEVAGIDTGSEEELLAFGAWFQDRFKPIYMSYQHALAQHAPEVALKNMDDKLEGGRALAVLEGVTFPYSGDTPYASLINPFDVDEPIEVTNDDIKEKIQEVKDTYPEARDEATRELGSAAGAAAVATAGGATALRNARQQAGRNALQTTSQATPPRVGQGATQAARAVAASTGTLMTQRSQVPNYQMMVSGNLTSLQAIRVRAYGVVGLQRTRVTSLLALENRVREQLEYSGDGSVSFTGSPEAIFREMAALFGLSTELDMDNPDSGRSRFISWFNTRFLPAFLAYAGGVRSANPSVSLNTAENQLSTPQKVMVGNAIMAACGDDDPPLSVWESPFVVYDDPQAASARTYALEDLQLLEETAGAERLSTPAQSGTQQGQDTLGGGRLNSSAINSALAVSGNTPTGPSSNPGATALERARARWGMGRNTPPSYGTPGVTPPRQPGGPLSRRGNAFTGFAQGNGGAWEEIPLPRSNRSYEAARPTLDAVEAMTGVSADLLATFASIESAFDYLVKAPTSSATGWFQFINATWDDMMERHAGKYGIPPDNAQRDLRKDPRVNALMGAEFLKGNYNYLKDRLGRTPTDTDLYLAHFFGAGTAKEFLEADSGANAASLFSTQAAANRSIFYKGGGQARTIAEVYSLMDEKVARHRYGSAPQQTFTRNGEEVIQLAPGDVSGSIVSVDSPMLSEEHRQANRRSPSLNARANRTVNPYSQAGAGTLVGGQSNGSAPLGQSTESDDPTSATDPVLSNQEQLRERAALADRRQQQQQEENRTQTREMGRLLTRQLEVQQSMRDYLKEIAKTVGGIRADGASGRGGSSESAEEQSSNDTSRPPDSSADNIRRVRAPVLMSR